MRKIISTTKVVLSALLLIPILLLVGCPSSCGETAQIQKNMTEGLKKIYGKDFVVGRPHMTGNPGFGYHYEAKAHPKDNPEIKFTVAYDMNQNGDYGDNYLEKLWSYQGNIELSHILKDQYGDNYYIYIYSIRYNNHDLKSLNYSEVLKASEGWAHIWIEYYIFTDHQIDKNKEAEKIYKVMDKFILNNSIKRYFMIVGYSPKKYKSNTNIYHKEYSDNGKSLKNLYHEGILSNYIEVSQAVMDNINIRKFNVNEIVQAFK